MTIRDGDCWSRGTVQVMENAAANPFLTIEEPAA
jgi:hypothetical protein